MSELIYGYQCVNRLPQVLDQIGKKEVFVIASVSVHKKISPILSDYHCTLWVNKTSLPVIDEAKSIYTEYLHGQSGILIAVGGGVVLDYAKFIIHFCLKNDLVPPVFIAIPSIAGSGAESTQFAVIYDHKIKRSIADNRLKPSWVFLDASLLHSISAQQKAVSGMDILSQAVESWWSKSSNTYTKVFSEAAAVSWHKYFENYVNSSDLLCSEKILIASNFAGKAIDFTKTTGPHALSYYLTSYHGIPHGMAVGLLLPVFVLYNQTDKELCHLFDCVDAEDFYRYIIHKMKAMCLPVKLDQLNINKHEIVDEWIRHTDHDRFNNNPEIFDPVKIKEYLLSYL